MNLQQLQRTKPTRANEIRTLSSGDKYQWDQSRFMWILVERNPENNEKSRINNSAPPVNTGSDEVETPEVKKTLTKMTRAGLADCAKSLGYDLDDDVIDEIFEKYLASGNIGTGFHQYVESLLKDQMKALSNAVDSMVEKSEAVVKEEVKEAPDDPEEVKKVLVALQTAKEFTNTAEYKEAETKEGESIPDAPHDEPIEIPVAQTVQCTIRIKPVQPEEIKNPPKPWTPEKPAPNPVVEQVTKEMVSTELAPPPEETLVQTPEVTPEPPSDPVETPQKTPAEPSAHEVQTGDNPVGNPPKPPLTPKKPVPAPSAKTMTKIQKEIQAARLAKASVSKK